MPTLREITYDIKETLNSYSDDSSLSIEHIAFMFQNKRNKHLKNYISNLKKELPLEAMQLICITLKDDDTCEDDFKFLKGTVKIPSTLESSGRSNISQFFLNSRIAKWLNVIDYSRFPYIKSGRMNNKQIYVAIDPDSYPIVYSASGDHEYLEDIKLSIIAENPEEAYKLQCNKDVNCDFYDSNYPIESSMIDLIKSEIIQELLIKYKIPVDQVNNGQDDTNQTNDPNEGRRTRQS